MTMDEVRDMLAEQTNENLQFLFSLLDGDKLEGNHECGVSMVDYAEAICVEMNKRGLPR